MEMEPKLKCSKCNETEPWGRDPKDRKPGESCASPDCNGILQEHNPIEAPPPEGVQPVLPEDSAARKEIPIFGGVLAYFPNAAAALAAHSKKNNDKHNPGEPMHWARSKSDDHAECIARHLVDHGGFDSEGNRHSTGLAWRALALLEEELIAEGATPGRNAR